MSPGVVGTKKVVDHGPDKDRWNLVIVGDGYQKIDLPQPANNNQGKYYTDVQNFITMLQTTPPFDKLFSGINVHRIDVESTDSGADNPIDLTDCPHGTGLMVNTYFDATYCSIGPGGKPLEHLLTINSDFAMLEALAQVPHMHQLLCIVNSSKYGGSGKSGVAVCSTDPKSSQIAIHEIGHSLGLADEYDEDVGAITPTTEPLEPNVTLDTNRSTNKWRALIAATTPMPSQCQPGCADCTDPVSPPAPGAVGAYEGAMYSKCKVYRPAPSCYMRDNLTPSPFCPVCTKVIRETLYTFTFRHDNDVELKINGNQALQSILDSLSDAKHHIHIEMMLFFYDPVCREIAEVLKNKASSGVKVRVMFDHGITTNGGYFASATSMKPSSHNSADVDSLVSELKGAGVNVIDSFEVGGGRMNEIWNEPPYPPNVPAEFRDHQQLINDEILCDFFHHDHRKIIVVDGKVGFIGSLNFGEEYLYHQPLNEDQSDSEDNDATPPNLPTPNDKWEKWHDLIVRIAGPIVGDLQKLFVERWLLSTPYPDSIPLDDVNYFPPIPPNGSSAVKVITSGPGLENEIRSEILDLINASTSSVYVENPYFYDDDIVSALKSASQRGVSVKVIEPAKNDCYFCHDAGQERYDEMIAAGIKVYEYRNHFSHCKIATIDERYTILGSYNFNWRSAYKDLEANIVVDNYLFAQLVNEGIMNHDIIKSDPITVTDFSMDTRNPITFFLEKIHQM